MVRHASRVVEVLNELVDHVFPNTVLDHVVTELSHLHPCTLLGGTETPRFLRGHLPALRLLIPAGSLCLTSVVAVVDPEFGGQTLFGRHVRRVVRGPTTHLVGDLDSHRLTKDQALEVVDQLRVLVEVVDQHLVVFELAGLLAPLLSDTVPVLLGFRLRLRRTLRLSVRLTLLPVRRGCRLASVLHDPPPQLLVPSPVRASACRQPRGCQAEASAQPERSAAA